MKEVLPPMIMCKNCVYSKPFVDMFNGKLRYQCQKMEEVGEFGDFYTINDSGCVEGIKIPDNRDKEGRWVAMTLPMPEVEGDITMICDTCKEEFTGQNDFCTWQQVYHYCPNCGAKMY